MEVEEHVQEELTPVQVTAERIARREFVRKGGKLAIFTVLGTWALGAAGSATAHPSASPHCETIGFGCDCVNAECRKNGVVCTKRFGACPSGGYCWTENYGGNNITCCDWTCAGYACHCCRIN